MLRSLAGRTGLLISSYAKGNVTPARVGRITAVGIRHGSEVKFKKMADEHLDNNFENFFNDPDIDGWSLRQAINDFHGLDVIPEPRIMIAVLKACRRLDDYACAVRYLEAVKFKCGGQEKTIWPYLMQEIGPTMEEIGILSPEQMGYDKPELYLKDVMDIH